MRSRRAAVIECTSRQGQVKVFHPSNSGGQQGPAAITITKYCC